MKLLLVLVSLVAVSATNFCPRTVFPSNPNYARYEAPDANNYCTTDNDCMTSGCSGEICAAEQLISTCEAIKVPKGGCSCINNRCSWAEQCRTGSCPPILIEIYCEHGWQVDEETGCEIGKCASVWENCPEHRQCLAGDVMAEEFKTCCGRDEVCVQSVFPLMGGECREALNCPNTEAPVPIGCRQWNDGCNTCQIGKDGCPTEVCTKRACLVAGTPFCQCLDCPPPPGCPAPPEGCSYETPETDNCSCAIGCGPLTCEEVEEVEKKCCDPELEPGTNGNPIFFEGHKCCHITGKWVSSIGDGKTFPCGDNAVQAEGKPCPGKKAELCCDPNTEPGTNGLPLFREGHMCCHLTGQWVSSIGDGKTFPCGDNAVQATGKACRDKFCNRKERTLARHVSNCAANSPASCSTDAGCKNGESCYTVAPFSDYAICCPTLQHRIEPADRCLARSPPMCGGIAGLQCSDGFGCIDDPRDNCDPTTGGADCTGICCCEGKECPSPQNKCDRRCRKRFSPKKFYWNGEYTADKFGCETQCKCEACPKPSSKEECENKCTAKGKLSALVTRTRNGVECEDMCSCFKPKRD